MSRLVRALLSFLLLIGQPGIALADSFNPANPNVFTYAGNPNGHLGCNAGVVATTPPDLAWDTTDAQLWTCITTGTASTAVWLRTAAQIAPTSTANAVPQANASGTIDGSYLGNTPVWKQPIDNGIFQVAQRGSSFSSINGGAGYKIIFLTSNTGSLQSWTVPADFSTTNTIITIGAGGAGGGFIGGAGFGGSGGGGAAFAFGSNLNLSGSVSYQIASATAGVSGNNPGGAGGYTWFNAASYTGSGNCTSTVVAAMGGSGGTAGGSSGGAGGTTGNSCGYYTAAGGAGGSTSGNGAGGGGAGGPQGTGGAGGADTSGGGGSGGGGSGGGDGGSGGGAGSANSGSTGGAGGNNSAGVGRGAAGAAGTLGGGGGGGSVATGGAGGPGADYPATAGGTAGPGGGGGGAGNGSTLNGGNGGNYGGGGGGENSTSGSSGGGAQGLIIIIYTPLPYSPTFTLDRWFVATSQGAANLALIQGTDTPTGYSYDARLQRPNGNAIAATSYLGQTVLTSDAVRWQGQSATLSFWAKAGANYSPAGGSLGVQLVTGTGADEGAWKLANGTWSGQATPVNTTTTITTTWTQYSFTGLLSSSIQEIGVLLGFTPTGTASTNDWFEVTGVAIQPAGTAYTYNFPTYSVDLYEAQRTAVVASVWVPSSTTNCLSLHMRAVPSISGGGTGFVSSSTTANNLVCSQTTANLQSLILSADP